ncbi:MAG TPA: hypothetical protein ENF22_01475 [Chloroflexi bacterium]|nr:hypothetical protein [Chloroflexota bacterium]
MNRKRIGQWILVVSLLFAMVLISGCQSSGEQPEPGSQVSESTDMNNNSTSDSGEGTEDSDSGETQGLDPLVIAQQEWEISAHASSFVVDSEGNNNPCARCHAPMNWMPTLDDIPESCQACKFELPVPPSFIQESEWQQVSCLYCHEADKKGNIQPEVSWLEIPALEEYSDVESHSELCLKCHNTENVPEHGLVVVGSGHADMQCTECHSPHNTTTTCMNGDCHSDVLSDTDQILGHDDDHKDVSCAACHDSAGWDVGPDPETGIWTTFSPWSHQVMIGEADSILQSGTTPFSSHDIGLEVNCERCHFSGNPWELTESVEIP